MYEVFALNYNDEPSSSKYLAYFNYFKWKNFSSFWVQVEITWAGLFMEACLLNYFVT